MNITDNLTRIKEGKDNIIKSLKNKGVEISNNTLINEISTYVDKLEIGGSGDTPIELVPKYEGASVFRVEVPEDNIRICFTPDIQTYKLDWGDGSDIEEITKSDWYIHTYEKKGIYDINVWDLPQNTILKPKSLSSYSNSNNWTNIFTYPLDNPKTNGGSGYAEITNNEVYYITHILIGKNIKNIYNRAFYGCNRLQNIVIPDSVTSIGDYAFNSCTKLTSITIPNSVTSIGDKAFYNCSSLTSITIPNSVTSIGNNVFYGCTSLTSITIPNSVTSIGDAVFSNCTSLTSITIPDSVKSINSSAFYNCSSLTSITIPDSVTSIGTQAFYQCKCLHTIICESITAPKIQSSTFDDVGTYIPNTISKLLYIPEGSSDYDSGYWLSKLLDKGFNITNEKPNEMLKTPTTINYTLDSNYIDIPYKSFYPISKFTNTLNDGNGIINIEQQIYALSFFSFPYQLITSINIPEGVAVLDMSCFFGCGRLEYISLPSTLKSIGYYTFGECYSLISISIPDSVTSIGDYAFKNCSKLSIITCKSMTAPTIQSNTFQSIASSGTRVLRVPEGAEGYDSGYWKSTVLNKGYTLEYIPLSEL